MSAINSLNSFNPVKFGGASAGQAVNHNAPARAQATPAQVTQSILDANQSANASALAFNPRSLVEAQRDIVSRFYDLQALAAARGGLQVEA